MVASLATSLVRTDNVVDGLIRALMKVHHLLRHLLCLASVLTSISDGLSKALGDERYRKAGKGEEGRNRRSPPHSQVSVHVSRKERKGGVKQPAENGAGCKRAGGEDGVCINGVVHQADEYQHLPRTEEARSDDADNPVDRRLCCEGEPEKTKRQCDTANQSWIQTAFRSCFIWVSTNLLLVGHFHEEVEEHGKYLSDHDTQIR